MRGSGEPKLIGEPEELEESKEPGVLGLEFTGEFGESLTSKRGRLEKKPTKEVLSLFN